MSTGSTPTGASRAVRRVGSVGGVLGVVGLLLLTLGLLVMHGLDPSAHPASEVGASGATAGSHADHDHADHGRADPAHDDQGCPDCVSHGHLVAVCVAVLVTVVGVGAFRLLRGGWRTPRIGLRSLRVLAAGLLEARARPPDPAWVRLGVMRC